jgi:hypothetical protein
LVRARRDVEREKQKAGAVGDSAPNRARFSIEKTPKYSATYYYHSRAFGGILKEKNRAWVRSANLPAFHWAARSSFQGVETLEIGWRAVLRFGQFMVKRLARPERFGYKSFGNRLIS